MPTRELLTIALTGVAGLGLGVLFFGGLWWTVQKAVSSQMPALWFAGSALIRTGVALAGLYFLSAGDWRRLAACLVGFIAARSAVIRVVGSPDAPALGTIRESNHAP